MTREAFDKQLEHLKKDVLALGVMVDEAIDRAIQALKERNKDAANQVVENDRRINAERLRIEEKCLELIATQQPMAIDLRVIAAALNIVTDLERMGDHAEGIGKITLMMGDEPLLKPLVDIPRMAEKDREMLRRSLNAFVTQDVEEATRVCIEDDEVDALYNQIYRELLTFMIEDPRTITRATYLLWVGHNLERIGDRVTNICERVAFMATGRMVENLRVSAY